MMTNQLPKRLWTEGELDSAGTLRLVNSLKTHLDSIAEALNTNAADKDLPYYSRDRFAEALSYFTNRDQEAEKALRRCAIMAGRAIETATAAANQEA